MTCIIGVVGKDGVYMGADSCASSGINRTIRKDKKLFSVGEFIIGCTTSFRMIQILQYSFIPPKVNTKDIQKYMCTSFVDELRKVFKEKGYLQKYDDGDEKGGTFLVAYKNRLFRIGYDFQVEETLIGYNAVGCGEQYALGSLYNSHNAHKQNTKDIVRNSLLAAQEFSGGVSEPFHFMKTDC